MAELTLLLADMKTIPSVLESTFIRHKGRLAARNARGGAFNASQEGAVLVGNIPGAVDLGRHIVKRRCGAGCLASSAFEPHRNSAVSNPTLSPAVTCNSRISNTAAPADI